MANPHRTHASTNQAGTTNLLSMGVIAEVSLAARSRADNKLNPGRTDGTLHSRAVIDDKTLHRKPPANPHSFRVRNANSLSMNGCSATSNKHARLQNRRKQTPRS